MSKNTRTAAVIVAENTPEQENSQVSAIPTMQVLKPEPTTESSPDPEQPQPVKPLSISDIKRKAQEMHYLAEQHDNLTGQLEKVQQFAAEVGENATLRLTSDGQHSFTSKDPAAVSALVEICIRNIKSRIDEVEAKLAA